MVMLCAILLRMALFFAIDKMGSPHFRLLFLKEAVYLDEDYVDEELNRCLKRPASDAGGVKK